MNQIQNRRTLFRRYADRRVAALLELHEILFYEPAGEDKNRLLMNTVNADYQTDRVALVQSMPENPTAVAVLCTSENWPAPSQENLFAGPGIQRILQTHRQFEGALTLSRFRSSSTFSHEEWQYLWERDLVAPATAILSVPVYPPNAPVAYLWLVADSGSREWSSHDRDLSEEQAVLLARVIETGLLRRS